MKYEFTIEELNCFTITLEVESQDDENLDEDAAWDKFNSLKSRWHDHPTCIEHDTHCDIQVSKMEKQEVTLDEDDPPDDPWGHAYGDPMSWVPPEGDEYWVVKGDAHNWTQLDEKKYWDNRLGASNANN